MEKRLWTFTDVFHVLAAEGVRSNQSNPPRYGPAGSRLLIYGIGLRPGGLIAHRILLLGTHTN